MSFIIKNYKFEQFSQKIAQNNQLGPDMIWIKNIGVSEFQLWGHFGTIFKLQLKYVDFKSK